MYPVPDLEKKNLNQYSYFFYSFFLKSYEELIIFLLTPLNVFVPKDVVSGLDFLHVWILYNFFNIQV